MTNPTTTFEYDVFISYNQNDEAWAKQLATRLEQEQWQGRKLKVFFAPWDIKPGESIPERLEYALPRSRKVCLIMSPESAASEWVKVERYVTHHIDITERQLRLIPLYRRASDIPPFLQQINRIDFQDDAKFEGGYRLLLATIKDEPLPRGEQEPSAAAAAPAPIPRPPVVGFVARRDSEGRDIVERLKAELAPQANQLIVLSGPGGVGKTTLAAETVRALRTVFSQRIVWISALGRDDFALSTLLDEIATQLGRPDLRLLRPDAKSEEVRALTAVAPTLIILDNFETIADAEKTSCVEFLSDRAFCPVLITTRPKIASARNIIIPAMSIQEADDFLQRLIEQTGNPSAFSQRDRERIKKASDRTPLVMQWVVAQIELAQEADTVLDELAQGIGDAAERVFDRSFDLEQLGDDGRAVLLALSLFAPDASRNALAQAAGFGEDIKRLNEAVKRLAGLWLIKTTAEGRRLSVEGLTRELAKARLTRDSPASDPRKRFVMSFLEFVRTHAAPTPENYEALEAEKANLLSAMDVAFDMQDWGTVQGIAYILALPISGMLSMHGYWDEAIRRNQQALRAARESSSEKDVSSFAHNAGVIHQNRGEIEEARLLYQESMGISKKLGDERSIALTLHQLGALTQGQGELEEARRLYNESLEISKRLGDEDGIALTLHQLGILSQDQGKMDEARQLYNESLGIERKLGNQRVIASTTSQLGIVHKQLGERAESRAKHEESLAIRRKLGDKQGIAIDLNQLAGLAQEEGDFDEARRLYNESLKINKKLGSQSGIAVSLHNLATLAVDEGDNETAVRLFCEALAIFEKLQSPRAALTRRNLERVVGKQS